MWAPEKWGVGGRGMLQGRATCRREEARERTVRAVTVKVKRKKKEGKVLRKDRGVYLAFLVA